MRLTLPSCGAHADLFTLSPEDRRELVRRIAEEGPDAIDAFVREREAQGDTLVARKARKLREELLRRAEELRRRLAARREDETAALEADFRERLARLERDRSERESRLARLDAEASDAFAAALRANPALGIALDAAVAARPPWHRRLLRALGWILRGLLFPLLWLLRKLMPPRRAHDKRVALVLPRAGDLLARAGDLYLSDPTFRGAVRARLREAPSAERLRRAWERLLGREDYETLARRAMAQMMAEEAERLETERSAAARRLQDELSSLAREEDAARRAREQGERSIRDALEAEARQLEEALRTQPEREVREAIVEELRGAGLLRRSGAKILPTLQFMDRFAALVYDEEAHGTRAGAGGAMGAYAEGEGVFVRGPLRSAVEVSRMDIPASLLRARTRHPHVRHLTEDDVVIHREERMDLTHVVLVVDRSGSMEENGRMEAAKRAALALHHAVKQRNPRNPVDVLLMDTSVRAATLRDVWDAEPRAFTNTGAAFRLARQLVERRRAGRSIVYLVTDGLPEAYTRNGEDVAGHPDRAMAYARQEARLLARERAFAGLVMLLLEPEDERHVKAADELAEVADGRVVPVAPQELARTLLRQFEGPRAAPRAQ